MARRAIRGRAATGRGRGTTRGGRGAGRTATSGT